MIFTHIYIYTDISIFHLCWATQTSSNSNNVVNQAELGLRGSCLGPLGESQHLPPQRRPTRVTRRLWAVAGNMAGNMAGHQP